MTVAVGVLVLLALGTMLYLTGRAHERRAYRDWRVLMTREGEHFYQQQLATVAAEMAAVDVALEAAAEADPLVSSEQALSLIGAGFGLISHHAQSMRNLLAGMAVYSRMVSAMLPVAPVPPRRFRLRQLVSAAYLAAVFHHLLVTAVERYRLRVYVLRFGFGAVVRYLRRGPGAVTAAAVGDARHDLGALTDESMESLRVLLTSMAAERRA